MILELKHVYKDYSHDKVSVPVLKDVSFGVKEGDYVAIMGPSGSGKTTLMNLIGCLDVPSSGEVLIDGIDISTRTDDQMAEIRNSFIGFVFQHFHLLPEMDALHNVALPLLYADVPLKDRLERAKEALISVGLEERMAFKPNQMSGGQCQRVAIARAMVTKPTLLLADEPTGALDTASGDQIMEIFEELNKQGMTIIMITHEPSIAECAQKTFRICDGQISGDPKELYLDEVLAGEEEAEAETTGDEQEAVEAVAEAETSSEAPESADPAPEEMEVETDEII